MRRAAKRTTPGWRRPRRKRWYVRGFPSEPLEERAAVLVRGAAERLFIAHMRSEEAEGVARAVRFARGGEAWRPRDVRREAEEVFGFAAGVAWPVRSAERTLRVENAAPGRFGQAVDVDVLCLSDTVKRWCWTSSSGVGRAKRSNVRVRRHKMGQRGGGA